MDAGALDQVITIEQPTATIDALGQEIEGWATASTPWAKVMETPGREFLKGDYRAEEKTVFVVRWREINSTARVKWGLQTDGQPRVWRIVSVTGTRREGYCYLHCVTTEGAN